MKWLANIALLIIIALLLTGSVIGFKKQQLRETEKNARRLHLLKEYHFVIRDKRPVGQGCLLIIECQETHQEVTDLVQYASECDLVQPGDVITSFYTE